MRDRSPRGQRCSASRPRRAPSRRSGECCGATHRAATFAPLILLIGKGAIPFHGFGRFLRRARFPRIRRRRKRVFGRLARSSALRTVAWSKRFDTLAGEFSARIGHIARKFPRFRYVVRLPLGTPLGAYAPAASGRLSLVYSGTRTPKSDCRWGRPLASAHVHRGRGVLRYPSFRCRDLAENLMTASERVRRTGRRRSRRHP
jgi:hypothetical protein